MTGPWPLPLNDDLIATARDFLLAKWRERADEMGMREPYDLSGSCKFSSLFAAEVFGLEMAGNWDHQFCMTDEGEPFDLNAGAADIEEMDEPYLHDEEFWMNPEHAESLESCRPRVRRWLEEFAEIVRRPGPEAPA